MAEDAAYAIENGQPVDAVVPKSNIDIAKSLLPFVVVFDNTKKAVASSGMLGNSYPALPDGVFDYVSSHGEDRLTWMSGDGVRIAAVVVKYGGKNPGYVLAGRSLREAESRVDSIGNIIGVLWLCALIAAFVVVFVGSKVLVGRKNLKE